MRWTKFKTPIGSIAKKLDKVPFDQISSRLLTTMASLDQALKSTDRLMRQVDDISRRRSPPP